MTDAWCTVLVWKGACRATKNSVLKIKLAVPGVVYVYSRHKNKFGTKPLNQHKQGLFELNEPLRDHASFKLTALSAGSFEAHVQRPAMPCGEVHHVSMSFGQTTVVVFLIIQHVFPGANLTVSFSCYFIRNWTCCIVFTCVFRVFVSYLCVPLQLFLLDVNFVGFNSHVEVRPTSRFICSRHFPDLDGQIRIFTRTFDDI